MVLLDVLYVVVVLLDVENVVVVLLEVLKVVVVLLDVLNVVVKVVVNSFLLAKKPKPLIMQSLRCS